MCGAYGEILLFVDHLALAEEERKAMDYAHILIEGLDAVALVLLVCVLARFSDRIRSLRSDIDGILSSKPRTEVKL